MPPAFNDSTSARTVAALEVGDDLVAGGARQAAVVAGHRRAGALGEMVGEPDPPLREVREHQHALARREHRVDDLLEPRELARPALERKIVVLVGGGVVADLLERGDRGEDLTVAGLARLPGSAVPVTSVSSSAWYRPICSGVIAQRSSSSIWSGSSSAIAGSAFVRRNTRMPLSARIASSASTRAAVVGESRDELRAGTDEPGIGEVEDRPEVAEAVLDRRAGERDPGASVDAPQLL